MKVYVLSQGQYYAGRAWVRNRAHAIEFVDRYGRTYAITQALRLAEFFRNDRIHYDARPISYLDDLVAHEF